MSIRAKPIAFDAVAIRNALAAGLRGLPELEQCLAGSDRDVLLDALTHYLAALCKWNKAYNLTAVREPADMVTRHIVDALSVQPYLHGTRVLDVGTGAGLPGIPLALVNPDKHFTLLDSNGKKVRFVQHAVGALGLRNVKPVQARVEAWETDETYDTIISRAFSSLADFINSSGRLLAPDGCLLAMKGKLPLAEIHALPSGWRVTGSYVLAVPGLDAERHALVLQPAA
jgi:16S rRNA (guanine527-N7)-methyltransferase